MVITDVSGGLGNQMFQYAAGRCLAMREGVPLFLDISSYTQFDPNGSFHPRPFELDIFNLRYDVFDHKRSQRLRYPSKVDKIRNIFSFPKIRVYREKKFCFNAEWNVLKPPVYIAGQWQTEKYFIDHAPIIKQDFSFTLPIDERNRDLANEMKNCTSVSVHFRRGDYLTSKGAAQFHGTPPISFYRSAFDLILDKDPGARFYIFSDDPGWVSQNFLHLYANAVLVDHNKERNSWKDMYLMSCCNHNIVANSSFSWWGAWLNGNVNKICIAPEEWFKIRDEFIDFSDVVPPSWIKL